MKKWAIGSIIVLLFVSVLSLFAVTGGSSKPYLNTISTPIANLNTSTEGQIEASHAVGTMMPTAMPTQTAQVGQSSDRHSQTGQNSAPEAVQQERVVLYSANVRIIAQSPEAVIEDISQLTQDLGGWIVSSNTNTRLDYQQQAQVYGTMSLRIPADQLDYAVEVIKSHAVTVTAEVITGNDVTTQYVDMSSRLKNLEASEAQLQIIMKSAIDVQDVLVTFNELTRIRGEIESIRGQLNYYDEASSFSAVTVNIEPVQATAIPYQEPEWNPSNTAQQAVKQLENSLQQFVDSVIFMLIVWGPFAMVFLIGAFIVWRSVRLYRKRSK